MGFDKRFIALIALGILTIYIILEFLGIHNIIPILVTVNPFLLLLALGVHLATIGVLCLRIRSIAGPASSLKHYMKTTFAGLFVNFITPVMKIGGEPVKIYMLRKELGGSRASAAIVMDTFVEIMSSYITFLLVFVSFFFLIPGNLMIYYVSFLVITLVLSAVFLKVSLTPKWLSKIFDFFIRKLSRFVRIEKKDYATMYYDSFKTLLKNRKIMFSSLGFSLLGKVLEFIRIWLVFLALGTSLPWSTVAVFWGFLLVLLLIPWIPGGLGLIEAGSILAFVALGVNPYLAATAVILDRLIWFWTILFIGFAFTAKYATQAKEKI